MFDSYPVRVLNLIRNQPGLKWTNGIRSAALLGWGIEEGTKRAQAIRGTPSLLSCSKKVGV
jgi:hypothetical protein